MISRASRIDAACRYINPGCPTLCIGGRVYMRTHDVVSLSISRFFRRCNCELSRGSQRAASVPPQMNYIGAARARTVACRDGGSCTEVRVFTGSDTWRPPATEKRSVVLTFVRTPVTTGDGDYPINKYIFICASKIFAAIFSQTRGKCSFNREEKYAHMIRYVTWYLYSVW